MENNTGLFTPFVPMLNAPGKIFSCLCLNPFYQLCTKMSIGGIYFLSKILYKYAYHFLYKLSLNPCGTIHGREHHLELLQHTSSQLFFLCYLTFPQVRNKIHLSITFVDFASFFEKSTFPSAHNALYGSHQAEQAVRFLPFFSISVQLWLHWLPGESAFPCG